LTYTHTQKLRQFYEALKDFGAESIADYDFVTKNHGTALEEVGMDEAQSEVFLSALKAYMPYDSEEFLAMV
jgi:hypothetical protein